jgi:hypothetical protein
VRGRHGIDRSHWHDTGVYIYGSVVCIHAYSAHIYTRTFLAPFLSSLTPKTHHTPFVSLIDSHSGLHSYAHEDTARRHASSRWPTLFCRVTFAGHAPVFLFNSRGPRDRVSVFGWVIIRRRREWTGLTRVWRGVWRPVPVQVQTSGSLCLSVGWGIPGGAPPWSLARCAFSPPNKSESRTYTHSSTRACTCKHVLTQCHVRTLAAHTGAHARR